MKKLMMLALGAGLALGTVSFAQDSSTTPSSGTMSGDTTTKPKKTKKAKKSKTTTPSTTDSTGSTTTPK